MVREPRRWHVPSNMFITYSIYKRLSRSIQTTGLYEYFFWRKCATRSFTVKEGKVAFSSATTLLAIQYLLPNGSTSNAEKLLCYDVKLLR